MSLAHKHENELSRALPCVEDAHSMGRPRDGSYCENSEDEANLVSSGEESRLNDDLSSSLEDLVGNFDERINSCLKNPDVNTEDIAPVQVRTQDEVMAESQRLDLTDRQSLDMPIVYFYFPGI
ncbi:hypothetical protein COOONC_10044 [Cooperia oncophora]